MADHTNQNADEPTRVQMLGTTVWLMALLCLISIGLSLWAAGAVDEDAQVAIQWNAQGPTKTVSKPLGLILLPTVQVAFLLLRLIISSTPPHRGHLLQSRKEYRTAWITVVAVLTLGHALSLVGAAGYAVPVERIILTATTLVFAIIGDVITNARAPTASWASVRRGLSRASVHGAKRISSLGSSWSYLGSASSWWGRSYLSTSSTEPSPQPRCS